MKICEKIDLEYIKSKENIIRKSNIVVMDTNLSEKTIRYIAMICLEEDIKLVVEPVSVEKSKKLKEILDRIDYITPNLEEMESLTGGIKIISDNDIRIAVDKLKDKGLKNVILTLAERGIFISGEELEMRGIRRKESECNGKFLPPYKLEVVEVTGVGDALVAGFVYGIAKGMPMKISAKYGLAAAALTISTPYSVNPLINEEMLKDMVEKWEK